MTKSNLEKNGAAQAAYLSTVTGLVTLALVNLGTEISESFKTAVYKIGKLWMPGAEGIGPYSGKETLAFFAWLVSWFILHRLLRTREINHPAAVTVFLIGMALATTLLWPPVYAHLSGH